MKSIIIIAALFLNANFSFSQGILGKIAGASALSNVSAASLPSLSNIAGATSGIMSKLTPALALTAIQKPSVTSIVSEYLKKKANILPLLNTNKADYSSKLSILNSGLFGKLKSVLTVAQYSKFLGLKPQKPSPADLLSNLFY